MGKTNHKRKFSKKTRMGQPGIPKKINVSDQPEATKIWNPKSTLIQNYAALGLNINPNYIISESESENTKEPVLNVPEGIKIQKKHEFDEFEEEYFKNLIEKHGKNYTAMFRDLTLNYNQLPVTRLRRKCELYKVMKLKEQEKQDDNIDKT